MRKYILITILIFAIISCKEDKKSNIIETTNIINLTPGPIVNESLSKEQLEKIGFIQETFNEVFPVSLDETITNFKRDQNPDSEINVWLNMAKTFKLFASENSGIEKLEVRKEAFKLILTRSMMSEKEAINSSESKLLSKKEVEDILSNYTLKAKPIKVK
jgi:hypothetical protein